MNHQYETVTFGHWPQGANGEVRPIQWRVLAQEDGRSLILAERILDMQPYHNQSIPIRWEYSTLRQWLNEVFLHQAFTDAEQGSIFRNTEANGLPGIADDVLWQLFGMETVTSGLTDSVFLLSTADIAQYFPNEDTMFCPGASAEATEYVQERFDSGNTIWWLRSSMNNGSMAFTVSPCNSVGISAIAADNLQGVRPALWLIRQA